MDTIILFVAEDRSNLEELCLSLWEEIYEYNFLYGLQTDLNYTKAQAKENADEYASRLSIVFAPVLE